MPATTDSNTQKYKKVETFTKLKIKKDALSKKIESLYEDNTWDLKKKFEDLKENFEESSIDREMCHG